MGRPPLHAKGTKQIAVRLPVPLEQQLQNKLQLGESVSDLIRKAIMLELDRRLLKDRGD
jgi:Arc/MetJ-type ribon-helix-helix transcriptional regulator